MALSHEIGREPDGLGLGAGATDTILRDYTPVDVGRLAGSFRIRHTVAEMGANRLRELLRTEPYVPSLGALTGNQAVQQVKAGLKAIYLSGWQVAADANTAGQMYPDQSLYPVEFGAERGAADQRGIAAGGPDCGERRMCRRHLLDGADRSGCRGGVRRRAERL